MQLGRFKEAFDFAMRSHNLDSADSKLAEHVTQLRAKIDAGVQFLKTPTYMYYVSLDTSLPFFFLVVFSFKKRFG